MVQTVAADVARPPNLKEAAAHGRVPLAIGQEDRDLVDLGLLHLRLRLRHDRKVATTN